MGRPQSIHLARTSGSPLEPLRRGADVVLASVLLVALAPLIAVIAVMVRVSSHGPVLARQPMAAGDGGTTALLAFRTQVDGGATESHARLRAVVGAHHAYTPVGRQLKRLGLDRLPRLLNVLRGDTTLIG